MQQKIMKYTKEDINLENGLKREWLITNGLGGFASSTIIGINTRKYHGLLVAPLTPPARRYLILSKLDESVKIGDETYPIYSNMGKDYISEGYKYQTSFEKEEVPVYTYQVQGVKITKTICMEYGKNTVGVLYKIKNGEKPATLTLAPIMNFRDFHSMSSGHKFEVRQEQKGKKEKIIIDNIIQHPIYMKISEGKYIEHQNDTFRNMFYVEEQKRGFDPEENHVVVGRYEIDIKPNETKEISFVCSFEENIEEIDVSKMIRQEKKRIHQILKRAEITEDAGSTENSVGTEILKETGSSKKTVEISETAEQQELIKKLTIAADSFIVYRPSFSLHTIIAGYPWFLDWGRDSLIAFEGLLLKTKRYDLAKEVLLTMIRDIKYGLVPNGYSGFDNRPLYNSVDASLLLFEQVQKYLNYTQDDTFVKENIFDKLEIIIENYVNGIDVDNNNIYLDIDNLLVSGTQSTQNTWMDAKIGDFAVTPRNGKAVEINSMWYNSLKIMENLCKKYGKRAKAKKYAEMASSTKTSFEDKFYNARRKCLYDVLGDSKIRPNQLFALSLTYPIIDPNSEKAENMIKTIEKKLLNPYGLKTLAKGEEGYVEIYEGDAKKRDMSYHQGITWTWLLGLYFDSLKNMQKSAKTKKKKEELESKIQDFRKNVIKTFSKEIVDRGCVGSIAEIYDSCKPYESKGTISQAWSVAEILRIVRDK